MRAPTVAVIVLDAMGRDTLQRYLDNTSRQVYLQNLSRIGLGNILDDKYHSLVNPNPDALALALNPASVWADSVMGHRELMGYVDPQDYELFHEGFPEEYIRVLEMATGRKVLYNKRAGGGQAIRDNHDEHEKTGGLIVYASMCDPLIQIAACEQVINPAELAEIADIAFDVAQQTGLRITRSISRPYVKTQNGYTRTSKRKDSVIPLPDGTETFIDLAGEKKIKTISIGKCSDVVNTQWYGRGIGYAHLENYAARKMKITPKDKNPDSIASLFNKLRQLEGPTFIMCNLPDTDSLYGHDRDVQSNIASLEAFDRVVPAIIKAMPDNSYLFITADHGMRDGGDYGYHSREAVPLLVFSKGSQLKDRIHIPELRNTYAVAGYLAAQLFGFGEEFLERCKLEDLIKV